MSGEGGDQGGRDTRGRFAKGNRLGKGNPRLKRLSQFQNTLRDAVGPEDLEAVLRSLTRIARGEKADEDSPLPSTQDQIAAARVIAERCLGKPADPPVVIPEGLFDFELTDVRSSLAAAQQVTEAAGRGDIDLGTAKALGDLLDIRDRLEVAVLVERMDAVEARDQETQR